LVALYAARFGTPRIELATLAIEITLPRLRATMPGRNACSMR
jgi:hypothetical protein